MKKLKQNEALSVAIAILVVIFFFVVIQLFGTTSSSNSNVQNGSVIDSSKNISNVLIENTVSGSGKEAKAGQLITVHYVGTLEDGTIFDSSRDRGEPFQFILGVGQVIEGWEIGISGMRVGGKRILVIPPELAYGALEVGTIPPNSTILFEVELLDVENL